MPIGLTVQVFLTRTPGPSITRTFDTGVVADTRIYARDPDEILCTGAAAGMDEQKICRHIQPWNKIVGFVGFVVKTLDKGVMVKTQGGFLLSVPGAEDNKAVGKDVFAYGPNEFSLSAGDGHKIGKILYIEKPGRAMVVFLSSFSDKKMALNFKMKTAKFI